MPFPPMDRRVRLACLVGALAATVLFGWVAFAGRLGLGEPPPAGDFYDAQARALFDGRWDLPPEVLSIEAFVIDGRAYTYFGPVPAVLRMPVLAVTDRFDGRLTPISLLGAFGVSLLGVSMLSWRVRTLVRGAAPVHPREAAITGLFVFSAGAGSVLLYLGSQAVVYHEAILWGIAFALIAYHHLVGFLVGMGRRSLVLAGAFATLAILTRASVGAGPVVALGLVAAVLVGAWLVGERWPALRLVDRARALVPGMDRAVPARLALGALAVVAVPVVLYAAVNQAKFGSPFDLPIERQVFSEIDPQRQAALADNDGSLFGVRFVPTTLWQYARPDAVEVVAVPPWITFPRAPARVVGDITFDTLDEASSLTATMPLLVALGAVGLVTVWRPARHEEEGDPVVSPIAALRVPVLGAAAGFVGVLTIAFVANRYLGDALPLLVLVAASGLHTCGRRFGGALDASLDVDGGEEEGAEGGEGANDAAATRRRLDRQALAVGAALALLGVWGVAANLALAVEYQRVIAPVELGMRYDFVRFQDDVVGLPTPSRVSAGDDLPEPGTRGSMLVVGDCEALLWTDGHEWYLLEGEPDDLPVVSDEARPAELCRRLMG